MRWARRRSAFAAFALLFSAGTLAGSSAPVGADSDVTRSCSANGVTWTATAHVADTYFGPLLTVTTMTKTQGGSTVDAAGMTWEWRTDSWFSPISPGHPDYAQRLEWGSGEGWTHNIGPRRAKGAGEDGWWGVEPMTIFRSPRVVSPDGGCTIYFSPFANIDGQVAWPRVAVLGDSLTGQLFDPPEGPSPMQGLVESALNADSINAEVEGQGGRRWVRNPLGWLVWGVGYDATPLGVARTDLLDEFRGLTQHDPDGYVVALGANDALGIALTPDAEQAAYRTDTHNQIMAVWNEMWAASDCFVVVTAPEHGNIYDSQYASEAVGVNNLARWFSVTMPAEIKVVDFATDASSHQYGSASPWFVSDNLHLNPAGRTAYTAAIRQAANLCT